MGIALKRSYSAYPGSHYDRWREQGFWSKEAPDQPRLLIDLVLLYASSRPQSFKDLLDDRTERAFIDETFRPLYDGLTPLQRAITRRLLAHTEISSQEARAAYAKELKRASISPGSVSDALKNLVDTQVLTKPAGSSGGYGVSDPLFKRWLEKEL